MDEHLVAVAVAPVELWHGDVGAGEFGQTASDLDDLAFWGFFAGLEADRVFTLSREQSIVEIEIEGAGCKRLVDVRDVGVDLVNGGRGRVWKCDGFNDKAKWRHRAAFGVQEGREHVRGRCTDSFIGRFGLKFSEGEEGVLVTGGDDRFNSFGRSSVSAPERTSAVSLWIA
jgi:hypothetical protein